MGANAKELKDGDNQTEKIQTSHTDVNHFPGADSETLMKNGDMILLKLYVYACKRTFKIRLGTNELKVSLNLSVVSFTCVAQMLNDKICTDI